MTPTLKHMSATTTAIVRNGCSKTAAEAIAVTTKMAVSRMFHAGTGEAIMRRSS